MKRTIPTILIAVTWCVTGAILGSAQTLRMTRVTPASVALAAVRDHVLEYHRQHRELPPDLRFLPPHLLAQVAVFRIKYDPESLLLSSLGYPHYEYSLGYALTGGIVGKRAESGGPALDLSRLLPPQSRTNHSGRTAESLAVTRSHEL